MALFEGKPTGKDEDEDDIGVEEADDEGSIEGPSFVFDLDLPTRIFTGWPTGVSSKFKGRLGSGRANEDILLVGSEETELLGLAVTFALGLAETFEGRTLGLEEGEGRDSSSSESSSFSFPFFFLNNSPKVPFLRGVLGEGDSIGSLSIGREVCGSGVEEEMFKLSLEFDSLFEGSSF